MTGITWVMAILGLAGLVAFLGWALWEVYKGEREYDEWLIRYDEFMGRRPR